MTSLCSRRIELHELRIAKGDSFRARPPDHFAEWVLGLTTARRKYAAALELFLLAITAPTYVASAIAVAAWKKYVVVSLIHNGVNPRLVNTRKVC